MYDQVVKCQRAGLCLSEHFLINKRVYDDDASRNVTGRQRRRETTGIRPGEVTGARLRSHWMNLSLTDLTNLTKLPR